MKRHLSAEPIAAMDQWPAADAQGETYKPVGLWYDVDGDWQRWCEAESFRTGDFHAYALTVNPASILTLATCREIDQFTFEYRVRTGAEYRRDYIDWRRVASEYDGIEIAPYQWDRRLDYHTRWYYGWDCASGCLWRPTGLLSWEPLGIVSVGSREEQVA